MSRRTVINLVFFLALFFVMIFWALGNVVHLRAYEKPYRIQGEFEAAVGVRADSEVAYLGVHYGSVSSVERMPGGVRITMYIDKGKQIPKGSTASIFRKSAIGEPYIDFTPPDDFDPENAKADDFLVKGAQIPMDQTTIPLEFSELLRSASRLVSGIDPEKAGTLIHELSEALNGRAQSLRDLTESGAQLAETFAARTEELDRLTRNNTILTRVVAEHRASLGQSITNLRLLAESLRNATGDTVTVLEQGTQLFGLAADLVSDQKNNVDCILHDLVHVLDLATSPKQLAGLQTLLDVGPTGFGNVWSTRDIEADGVWVRVNLTVATENPAIQYNPPHQLPAVPAVGGCNSTVPPGTTGPATVVSASDLVSLGDDDRGSIAATGMEAMAWLAGILLATAAAFRWLGRPGEDEAAG